MESNLEQQIYNKICNFMVATGIAKNLLKYRSTSGKLNSVIVIDNVYYVVAFREGKVLRDFLRNEVSKEFPEENAQNLIQEMINNWQKLAIYCLMLIEENSKKQASN